MLALLVEEKSLSPVVGGLAPLHLLHLAINTDVNCIFALLQGKTLCAAHSSLPFPPQRVRGEKWTKGKSHGLR